MKSKAIFLLTLFSVLFLPTPAPCQDEHITLSTYYPSPFGEYEDMSSERLLVWRHDDLELADMREGDCHIGWSLIVGAGGTGYSYDEIGTGLGDGTVLIKDRLGIRTRAPQTALDLNGILSMRGVAAGAVSPANQGRIYFDSALHKFRVSEHGGDYVDLIGGGGGGFWEDTGAGGNIHNTNTGNVGIGSNNPGGYRLLVNGSMKIQSGRLALLDPSITVTSNQPGIVFGKSIALQKSNYYSGIQRMGSGAGGSYTLFTSGMANVMTLADTGSVGIGTTGPRGTLHLRDAQTGNIPSILIERSSTTTTTPRLVLVDTALGAVESTAAWGIDNYQDHLRIWRQPNISTSGWEAFNIANNGNITGRHGTYHASSDIRLKKDITTIDSALDKVLALRGVNFRWRDPSEDQSLHMDMIA